ncbi:unnamed protein product [Rhodiola kirilowii]
MAGENGGTDESVVLADRISKLPDEIREYILGYLPITDAVRTSVLSRKWRYTWTKIVQLNLYFNDDTENEMMTEDENHRYFRRVGRILMSHVGSIHKCVLRPLWYDDEGDMNAWLRLLSRKGIKDLAFCCHGHLREFELPPSIFNCLGLLSLTLENCNLRKSIAFKGFPNLATLKLYYVDIFGDMLEQVVSNCPLEMLSLEFCCFYSDKTNSQPSKNAISAPNLRVLSIVCYSHRLEHIYLKYTPNLRVVSFWIDCDGGDFDYLKPNCLDILRSMPKIEVLTFECLVDLYKMSDMCRIQLDKDSLSLKAAIAYLEVEAKEEIKTSITTIAVTFKRLYYEGCFGAEIAFIDIIVSCCPALGNLIIYGFSSIEDSAKLQLSRALRRIGSPRHHCLTLPCSREPGHHGVCIIYFKAKQNCSYQVPSGAVHYVAGGADNRLSKLKSQIFHTMESCENEDRLSALPNQLKEVILCCLPIADVVRTSVLSSEWRYIWTGLSNLDFGWRFWFWEQATGVMSIALTQILLAHKGHVQNVKITGLNSFKRGQGHIVIPSSVFECLQLKWLTLIDCVFHPPLEFKGFPNLVRLSLVHFYTESQLLRNLIRQCPLLETLIIFDYHLSAENTTYDATTVSLWGMLGYNPRGLRNRLRAWEFMSSLIGIKELSFQFSLLEISDSDIIPKKLPELLGNLKTVDLRYMDMSYMYRYRRQFDKDSLRAMGNISEQKWLVIKGYSCSRNGEHRKLSLMLPCPRKAGHQGIFIRKRPLKTAAIKGPQAVWSIVKQTKNHLFECTMRC